MRKWTLYLACFSVWFSGFSPVFAAFKAAPNNMRRLKKDTIKRSKEYISINDFHLKELLTAISEDERIEKLPKPLMRCYRYVLQRSSRIPLSDVIDALPDLLAYAVEYSTPTNKPKAPRPGKPKITSNSAVVGNSCSCDTTGLLKLLRLIEKKIGSVKDNVCCDSILGVLGDACEKFGPDSNISCKILEICNTIVDTQTIICDKFEGTWTLIADLKETLTDCCDDLKREIIDTRTIICDKLQTISVNVEMDLDGVFTTLVDLKATLTECCDDLKTDIFDSTTLLCDKFEGTWTQIADLKETLTECCDELKQDIYDTQTIICDKLKTMSVNVDLTGVYTSIADVKETLTECCDELKQDIYDTETILCDKFAGTFTTLDYICEKIENIAPTCTIENLTVTAVIDLNGVFTTLIDIDQTLTECCDDLKREIIDTRTIICDKLQTLSVEVEIDLGDVFTTLNYICDKIENISPTVTIEGITVTAVIDLNGVFTSLADIDQTLTECCDEIKGDIYDTQTILCDKFEGTWTLISDVKDTLTECCDELKQDIYDTQTIICDKLQSLTINAEVDLTGVFTVLADIDQTLTECCDEIKGDIYDTQTILCDKFEITWTLIDDLKETLTDCCAEINEKIDCFLKQPIRQSDVPFCIMQPGVYRLCEDLTCDVSDGFAIKVTATNVRIIGDMHSITSLDSTCTAILIENSGDVVIDPIYIRNANTAAAVIDSEGVDFDQFNTAGVNFGVLGRSSRQINVKNSAIRSSIAGIDFEEVEGSQIQGCRINQPARGIVLSKVKDFVGSDLNIQATEDGIMAMADTLGETVRVSVESSIITVAGTAIHVMCGDNILSKNNNLTADVGYVIEAGSRNFISRADKVISHVAPDDISDDSTQVLIDDRAQFSNPGANAQLFRQPMRRGTYGETNQDEGTDIFISQAGNICTPGTYRFAKDIVGTFTITVDNVILDLNGKTLSCTFTNGSAGRGIVIENRSKVTIKNGVIERCTNPLYINMSSNIQCENVIIQENTDRLTILDAQSLIFDTVTIQNSTVLDVSIFGGQTVDGLILKSCIFDGNVGNNDLISFIGAGNNKNIFISNSSFRNNSMDPGALIFMSGLENFIMKDSSISNNGGRLALFIDSFLSGGTTILENVEIVDFRQTGMGSPAEALGFGSADSLTLKNVKFMDAPLSNGVRVINIKNVNYDGCNFDNVGAYGLDLVSSKNCSILNTVFTNFGQEGIRITGASGLASINTEDISIKDCIITSTFASTGIEVRPGQFNDPRPSTKIAVCNSVISTFSVGILFQDVEDSNIFENKISSPIAIKDDQGQKNIISYNMALNSTIELCDTFCDVLTENIGCIKATGTDNVLTENIDTCTKPFIDLKDTVTICCNDLKHDIYDTQTILCDKFEGTFTTLDYICEKIENISPTCTIESITVTAVIDLNGVFTSLADIDQTLTECCDEIKGDIYDTQTILCDKFEGTFTTLDYICDKIEDLDVTVTVFNNITVTAVIDLNGVFTSLADIDQTLTECCDEIKGDIYDTQTILCDKFVGTFTTLDYICEKIENISPTCTIENITVTAIIDLNGVFTSLADIDQTLTECCDEIKGDIYDTQTILCDKFAGTFTTLDYICDKIENISPTCTIENITVTAIIDLNGVFTSLADIDQTLTECCDEIKGDIYDTQTILCDKFEGTFTTLDYICDKIEDLDVTVTVFNNITVTTVIDLNGVFTVLADIDQTLTECCDEIKGDIYDTQTILCDKFAGTFTTLDYICDKIEDLNVTVTIDGLTFTAIIDLNGVFTSLADIDQTLTECCDELKSDIYDTQTILCAKIENIDVTATVDLSGVFTTLSYICEKIEDEDDDCDVIKAALCTPTVIRQVNLDSGTTFTIDVPGLYVVAEPLTFSPSSPQPAIAIISDNVTLDFCCKSLSQGNSTLSVDGVQVFSGSGAQRNNVKIKNGTIQGFSRTGIVVGSTLGSGCSRVSIHNMDVVECERRGIAFAGDSNSNKIQNSEIIDCRILSCCQDVTADVGLLLSFAENVDVVNCKVNDSGNATVSFTAAINIVDSEKCFIKNTEVNCNIGLEYSGYVIDSSSGCILRNCLVASNAASVGFVGFGLVGGASCFDNLITHCSVQDSIVTNGYVYGYYFEPFITRNIVQFSSATSNEASGAIAAANCYGFYYDRCTFCSTVGCRAELNRATGDGTTNIAVGFNITTNGGGGTGVKNSEFKDCVASSNIGFNAARSYGIRAFSAANGNTFNAYINNIAFRNAPAGTAITSNQIVADQSTGSNPGGVPFQTISSELINNFGTNITKIGNVRIGD